MANSEHVAALLGDEVMFKKHFGTRGGGIVQPDVSGATLKNADCSNLRFGSPTNFSNANLSGTNFRNCHFVNTSFKNSDWTNCDFFNAHFDTCVLSSIRNAHKAKNLHTVTATDNTRSFESAERPWWVKLDWEMLKSMGRLPLFGVSTAALILLPTYFYLIDIYNQHLNAWKKALSEYAEHSEFAKIASNALVRLEPILPPTISWFTFVSAVLLLLGSMLYWYCPQRVKVFSRTEWCEQNNRSLVAYWGATWRFPIVRLFCAVFFVIGGGLAAWIISSKLISTAIYISRNSSFAWFPI